MSSASSAASSTLDDVCLSMATAAVGTDDQPSSLGEEALEQNAAACAGGQRLWDSRQEPAEDAQFLRDIAELNRRMSAQLVEPARRTECPPARTRPGPSRRVKQRSHRRLTPELLTSDEDANEFADHRPGPYLEPQMRGRRQAAQPNRRSSFETLYGCCGDAVDAEAPAPLVGPPPHRERLCKSQACQTDCGVATPPSHSGIGRAEQHRRECSRAQNGVHEAAVAEKPAQLAAPDSRGGNCMAGSKAEKRRVQQQQQQQQLPLQHVSRICFSVPSSEQPPSPPPQPPPPPQRSSRTVRFRSGSFSDFHYYYPAARPQSSELEIGILRQGLPAARGADEIVVTRMRRLDREDPVTELELMCRAMRLDDADLMEGAAMRDDWQPQQPQQQRRRMLRRQHRPAPDRLRDDQARRRTGGRSTAVVPTLQAPASSSGYLRYLESPGSDDAACRSHRRDLQRSRRREQPTNFIGRASDWELARRQGWWRRCMKRSMVRPPIAWKFGLVNDENEF